MKRRPADLGEDHFLGEVPRLADQDAGGLGHAFDDQAVRHDRERRVKIVQMLLGQRDVLDRRRRCREVNSVNLSIQIQRMSSCQLAVASWQ